jgi:disulfide oxidoreductase YuzD
VKKNIWSTEPDEHDFPAALDFLELLFSLETAAEIVARLKTAKTIRKKAKDILRASRLPLLPKNNVHVKNDLQKVKNGKKLSPILLVRDSQLIVADGNHRVCSIYYLSEDLEVPCRITDKA